MNIDEIKGLVEKYISNFQGNEDFSKIKANGEDLISTLGNLSGGLGGFAKAALGKLGLGNSSNELVEKALGYLGSFANSSNAKTDFSKLEDAVKKLLGA